VRIESSVTAVSWVPLDCVEGGQRLQFHVGAAQYDDPPPQHLDDLAALLAAGRVRLANRLEGFIEVGDGRIVAHGQSGQGQVGTPGHPLTSPRPPSPRGPGEPAADEPSSGSPRGAEPATGRPASGGLRGSDEPAASGPGSGGLRGAPPPASVGFTAVALPDLRPEPVVGDGWVRFGQTAGGMLSVGMPYRPAGSAAPRVAAPAAWTTLSLTIRVDGTSEAALAGASPFPRHWVYDDHGRLVATSGLVDFSGWQADAWDPFTPWGGRDAPARVTAVATALERELSRIIVGAAPHWLRLRRGATLVEQDEPGRELYLLFDGLLAVEVDGRTVGEIGPGAVVGEIALLEGGRRTATLRAVTPCRVAAVPGDRVDRAVLAELARSRGWPGPGGGPWGLEARDNGGAGPGRDDPA
jgi:Cyclic nucleotide-binding domain